MSANLQLDNFTSNNILESTELDADASVGTALTLASNAGIVTDDIIFIGNIGSERSEIRKVSSVNVNGKDVVLTATTLYPHSRFDKAIKLFGDQIKIYRAANIDGTTPDDADFSALTTISIDPDQKSTQYTDASGGSSYWYKYTFRNSVTTDETSLASSRAARGGSANRYASIDEIRRDAGFANNQYITDSMIDEKRLAAQSIVDTKLQGMYTVPFTTPINPLITEITIKIAAGLLLVNDYGTVRAFSTNDGQRKIDWANQQLDRIKSKEVTLTDESGDSTLLITASSISMYPNNRTANLDVASGGRMFRTTDRY